MTTPVERVKREGIFGGIEPFKWMLTVDSLDKVNVQCTKGDLTLIIDFLLLRTPTHKLHQTRARRKAFADSLAQLKKEAFPE